MSRSGPGSGRIRCYRFHLRKIVHAIDLRVLWPLDQVNDAAVRLKCDYLGHLDSVTLELLRPHRGNLCARGRGREAVVQRPKRASAVSSEQRPIDAESGCEYATLRVVRERSSVGRASPF